MQLKAIVNGKEIVIVGKDPVIDDRISGKLHISWPLKSISGTFVIDLDEQRMEMKLESKNSINWFFDLNTADNTVSQYGTITPQKISCQFKGMSYSVAAVKGTFSQPGNRIIFRISPEKNRLTLDFSRNNQH